MLKNRCKSRKEYLVFLVFCIGTIMLRVFYIGKVNGPFVYADEFGYWAHAAHMTGKTWAGVMDGIGWYGFGYSFILVPALLLSGEMAVIYKIAVLFNVAMCVAVYGLAYLIASRLFADWNALQRGAAAFAATSFSSYIFYSYVTMSETCVTLLLWLVFYEIISAEESPAWWKGVLLGVTLGFMYMVHNRMLGVIIAVFFCMLLLTVQRRSDWKTNALCLAALIFSIFLKRIFKGGFVDMIENNYTMNALGISIKMGNANLAGSQLQKVAGLFHLHEMKELVLNVIGQLWECMSATYLLFGLGSVYAVKRLWHNYRLRKDMCLYLFPMLAVILSIGITAVFFYSSPLTAAGDKIRIDTLFYGRYNECFFGMLILLGIGLLAENQKNNQKIYLVIFVVYIGLSAIMYMRLGNTDDKYLNVVSAIGIHMFHWLGEFSVWKCAVITILGAAILFGLYYVRFPFDLRYYAACLLLVFLFATTALYCMRISIRGENDYTAHYNKIFDYLKENTEKNEVIYICEREKMAYDVQTRLVDRIVVSIPFENMDRVQKGAYVIVGAADTDKIDREQCELCLDEKEYWVILK